MYIHHMNTNAPIPAAETSRALSMQAVVEVCFCHHVRRSARAITRVFDDAFRPISLKASQFNILAAVGAKERVTATAIASILVMDRTTLSRNLRPLRDAGYLAVDEGAGRRAAHLALTPRGQTVLSQAMLLWRGAQSELTRHLGAGQAGALIQALEAAARAVEKSAGNA